VRLTEQGDRGDWITALVKLAEQRLQMPDCEDTNPRSFSLTTRWNVVKGTAMEECADVEGETTAESPRNHLDNALKNMDLQGPTGLECFSYEPQAKKTRLEADIEASAQKNEVGENVSRDEYIPERRRKVPKRTPTVTIHQDFYKYLPSASPSIVPETILARYRLPPPACNSTALVLWSPPQEDSLGQAVPSVGKEEDETAQEDTVNLNRGNDRSDVHMEEVYSEVENDIEKKIADTKKGGYQGDTLWLEEDTNME